jgi:thioredoxin 1
MKNIKYQMLLFGALLSLSSFSTINNVYNLIKEIPPVKSKPINFIEDSYSTAMKKAKAEHKFIFVDAYTTWCGPCRQLKNTTFKDSQTADFFNQNFVNLSVDMEKGEGEDLAVKWEVQEYPTLLILDHNGKVLLRSIGYLNAKQLTAFGKKALQKM